MAIEREVASIDFAPAPAAAASAAPSAAVVASPAAAAGNNTSASKKNNVMGRPALACERCKRRKIKCDAIRPTCGKCVKMKTQCVYSEAAEHQMANPAKKRKRNKRSTQSSTAPDDDRHGSPSTRASFTSRSMSSDIDHQVNDKDLDAAFLLTNLAQTGPPPPPATVSAGMPPLRNSHSPSYAAMRHHTASVAYGPGSPTSSHFATAPGGRLPLPADRILPQPFSRHVQFGPLSHDRPAYDPATDFSAGRSGSGHLPPAPAPSSLKRSRSRSPSPRRSMVFIDARSRSPARRGGADAYAADKRSPGMPWPSASQPTEFLPAPPATKRLSDAGASTTSSASMRDDEHAVTPHGVHSHWLTVLDGPAPHSPSPRETAIVSPSSPPQSRPWSPSGTRSRTNSDPAVHVDTKHESDRAPQSPSSTNGRTTAYTVSKPQDRIDLSKLEQSDRAAEAGAVPIKQISQGPHQTWDKMVLFCM